MSEKIGGKFKIKAVKSYDDMYTVGDEFVFEDGRTVWKDGFCSNCYLSFSDFIKRNRGMKKDFILLYEKPQEENVKRKASELINKIKKYEYKEKEKK